MSFDPNDFTVLTAIDSIKGGGQLDEWKWGLSQADARRLNVSRSVVQRLWDQYQSEDFVSRRPVPGRPRATTLQKTVFSSFGMKEKNHYCAAARCRPLSSIRKKNLRYYGAKSSSQCRSVCKKTTVVCVPSTDDSEGTVYAGQERTCFLDAATMGFYCCSQTSPDLQWKVIQGVY
ncbi:uncharacterized protein TNCV_5012271 [Trichonephila clavipes]|nr:uncharacterized protein TNCV_5012271 [Trichonephila clavipes]